MMFPRPSFAKTVFSFGSVGAVLLCAIPGRAESDKARDKRACAQAYNSSVDRERAGHLREARDLLATCAKAACGTALQQTCVGAFSRLVDSDIPTVIPLVTDEGGARRTDVQVKMDGEVIASQLDGQEVPVDPGLHEFSFSVGGAAPVTQKILIIQGQRARVLAVSPRDGQGPAKPAEGETSHEAAPASPAAAENPAGTAPAAPPPEPEELPDSHPEASSSALPWVVAGAGVLGAGAGTLLVVLGKKDPAAVDGAFPIAASAGIGVAAVGVAIWLFARPPSTDEKPRPVRLGYSLDVHPLPSGAAASLTGTF